MLAHARALPDSSEAGATEYIDADLRDTGKILARLIQARGFNREQDVVADLDKLIADLGC